MSELKSASKNAAGNTADNAAPETGAASSRRSFLKTLAAGTVVGSAGALAPSLAMGQSGETIKIGFITSLTGPYSVESQGQIKGAELAIKEFNDAGGLKGRKAELLVRDDKLNPGEAATRTLELIEKDKVAYIVGSISAAIQLTINNIAKQRGVVFVSVSLSDTINEASDGGKYTFHEALNPHMSGGALTRHVFPKYGKRAVILGYDAAYGAELARAVQLAGKPLGVQFLDHIKHPVGQSDYSLFFPRILAAKPDVLVVCNFGHDQLNTFKQAHDFGLKKSMRITTPNFSSTARQIAGHEVFKDIIGGTNYYWTLENTEPAAKAFNAKFRAMHNIMPGDYAGYAYSGVMSLFDAMKAAGTSATDPVIAAMTALKYNHYKGPQHYRACDRQSLQAVLITESIPKSEAKNESDTMKIIGREDFDESQLRSCAELGYKA